MNVRYTSALLLVISFLASSLLLAVSPHLSLRSQGQNVAHTTIQKTKMHLPPTSNQAEMNSSQPTPSLAPQTFTMQTPVQTEQPNVQTLTFEEPSTLSPLDQAPYTQATVPFAGLLNLIVPKIPTELPITTMPDKTQQTITPSEKTLSLKQKTKATQLGTTMSNQQVPHVKQNMTSKYLSQKETAASLATQKTLKPKKLKDTPSTLITPKNTLNKSNVQTKKIQIPHELRPPLKTGKNTTLPTEIKHTTPTLYVPFHEKTFMNELRAQPTPPTLKKAAATKKITPHKASPSTPKHLAKKSSEEKRATPEESSAQKYHVKDSSLENPREQAVRATELPPSLVPTLPEQITESVQALQGANPAQFIMPTLPVDTKPVEQKQSAELMPSLVPTLPLDAVQEITAAQHDQSHNKAEPLPSLVPTLPAEPTHPTKSPQTSPTNWLDTAKNVYQKSITYLKDLFAPSSHDKPLNSTLLNSSNAASEVQSIDAVNADIIAGNFTLTPEVTRSFKPHALSRALLGCDLYNDTTIHVRGSALERNEEKDWLADYFYLSNKYESIICFTPRVTSFLTDLNLFINLESWFNGSFLRVQSPLTWTKWDLGMREQIINNGKVTGAQGWKNKWMSVNDRLLSSFTDYSCWEKAGTSYVDGVGLAHPLYAAKMCPCGASKTALADIHVDFGLYEHKGERYSVGLYARGVLPTGNNPDGEFLFEPIVGNGHHWELGAGATGYAQLWADTAQSREVGFYIDGSLTHLFGSHQQRVFDLKDHGPLSRYILLTNSATAPASITPAANITRAEVNVSIPVQLDLAVLVNYTDDVFSWNFGYNFWSRSCEKIDRCDITPYNVCDNCSAVSGLDGITWKPYIDATIKKSGTASLADGLSIDDLDLNAARTKGSSHKLFTSLNYSWIELDDIVMPFLGIGAEVELGNTSVLSSGCCQRFSLSQWGLWLRAGTEF